MLLAGPVRAARRLLYAVWRYYVAHAGVDELTVLPLGRVALGAAAADLRQHGGGESRRSRSISAPSLIALAPGRSCWRRQGWTPTTRLLAFHAAAFVLYNRVSGPRLSRPVLRRDERRGAFLFPLQHASVAGAGRWRWRWRRGIWPRQRLARRARPASVVAIAVALIGPLAFAQRLRFDLAMPQPLVWDLAAVLKPHLTDDDRLALLLPGDNDSVATMLGGVLRDVPPRRPRLDLLARRPPMPPRSTRRRGSATPRR